MSADAPNDLARVAAALRNEMRGKVSTLRRELTDELRRIDASAEQTGTRLDTLATEQIEFRQHIQRRLHDSALRVRRLEGEIQVIEGLLHRHEGQVPVDLDTVPAGLRSVVDAVREAERLRATLLDDDARAVRRRQIEQCADHQHTLAETRQRALSASRTLAVRKAGGWAFRRAAAAYRSERARLDEQEAHLATALAHRDAAERELRADATQQQAYRVHPGASATDRLTAYVRERIEAAVAAYELFPPWFTTVLGHRPAPTRAADWREAAIQLVLYRITYEVTDRVVALGPPPQGGHRAAQYHAVDAALRRIDE
jgi:hypothetical protein